MTDSQFNEIMTLGKTLCDSLAHVITAKYSLSEATDWPLLLILGGIVVALIGIMWKDLKDTIKSDKTEWKEGLSCLKAELKEAISILKSETKGELDLLWDESRRMKDEMKECKEKCCGE